MNKLHPLHNKGAATLPPIPFYGTDPLQPDEPEHYSFHHLELTEVAKRLEQVLEGHYYLQLKADCIRKQCWELAGLESKLPSNRAATACWYANELLRLYLKPNCPRKVRQRIEALVACWQEPCSTP